MLEELIDQIIADAVRRDELRGMALIGAVPCPQPLPSPGESTSYTSVHEYAAEHHGRCPVCKAAV